MKIRTDFVTNSSSSSFCSIHISSAILTEILKNYMELFEAEDVDISIDGENFEFSEEDGRIYEGPARKSDMAGSIVEFISELSECCEDPEEFDELIEELEENEEKINESITSLDWTVSNTGWGGDDETRIWHKYDEAFIRRYMHLKDEDEITSEIDKQFRDKVLEATSSETTQCKYDGKEFVITEDFELT